MRNKGSKEGDVWDYRAITYKDHNDRFYGITEVYYKKGKPITYTEDVAVLKYFNITELKEAIKSISEALKKPIIDIDNFPHEF